MCEIIWSNQHDSCDENQKKSGYRTDTSAQTKSLPTTTLRNGQIKCWEIKNLRSTCQSVVFSLPHGCMQHKSLFPDPAFRVSAPAVHQVQV